MKRSRVHAAQAVKQLVEPPVDGPQRGRVIRIWQTSSVYSFDLYQAARARRSPSIFRTRATAEFQLMLLRVFKLA